MAFVPLFAKRLEGEGEDGRAGLWLRMCLRRPVVSVLFIR